ncbi:MAG: TetR/AcrR family transcriptional regulator [Bacillota bacterium]|nr:TetR/AcrR family transcriptional regulator [Bacillota bacterium]
MKRKRDIVMTEKRILQVCIRLFLEKGYKDASTTQIQNDAKVSCSSFQNIFKNKEGVLLELVKYMFKNQFGIARNALGEELSPVYVYGAETAIQLTLTELNENLRDIYVEAYTRETTLDYIQKETTKELKGIFGAYQPELTEKDFYQLELGTAGLMRGYMANPCTEDFTLEQKLNTFLTLALRCYKVPEDEIDKVLAYIAGLDVRNLAQSVMEELFEKLAMRYEFSLEGLLL